MRIRADVEWLPVDTGRLRLRCGNLRWSPFGRDGGIGRRGGLKIWAEAFAERRQASPPDRAAGLHAVGRR